MRVLIRPKISEKTSEMEKLKETVFIVDRRASKPEISREVERLYGVKVLKVRTLTQIGKTKKRNTKRGVVKGKKPSFKKAIVRVGPDDFIDFFSQK